MIPSKRCLLFLSICLPLCIMLMSCGKSNPSQAEKATADTLRPQTETQKVVGIANIEPRERILQLSAERDGIIIQVLHDVNETVKKGDVILRLAQDVELAQTELASARIATQQAAIQAAAASLQALEVNAAQARENARRDQRLAETQAGTRQAADDARANADNLDKQVLASRANLEQAKQKLTELQADLNYYQQVLEQKNVRAPADGTILSLDVKTGSHVTPSQSLGDFAPVGAKIAVTEIDELFAERVKEGQQAWIRAQGGNDTLAKGTVFLLSPYLRKKSLFSDAATNLEDRRVREVRVLLDEGSSVLIGSRVECVIRLQ